MRVGRQRERHHLRMDTRRRGGARHQRPGRGQLQRAGDLQLHDRLQRLHPHRPHRPKRRDYPHREEALAQRGREAPDQDARRRGGDHRHLRGDRAGAAGEHLPVHPRTGSGVQRPLGRDQGRTQGEEARRGLDAPLR